MTWAELQRGIDLFNSCEFFAAHEALEDAWRAATGPEKLFLQGLVQAAVAMHHHATGNYVGARSVLQRARRNLSGYPESYLGIKVVSLRQSLSEWQEALAEGGSLLPLPRMEFTEKDSSERCTASHGEVPGNRSANISSFMKQSSRSAVTHSVPLLDLQRQYAPLREEILAAIERVCGSQKFILGEEVEALESEMAAYTGAAASVGCASGTDALWLALVAVGVGPGDAVITSPFSFFASGSAIVRAGARPVFADVDAQSLNLDPQSVRSRLEAGGSHKIKALLPVHLYGQCADVDAFAALAEEFKLAVVEDAAQAIGARWRERGAGSLGVTAAFSFYPTKNLSAFGDAGIVTTREQEMARRMRRLRNHGSPQRYVHEEMGWNCRLDAIQAAVLRVKLPHVEEWNRARRARAAEYDRLLAKAGFDGDSPVKIPFRHAQAQHVFHQYVIRAERRDELRAFLKERGIGTEVYYPLPIHLQPSFTYLGYQPGDMPKAEKASRDVLALPIFPELTEDEQQWVVNGIAEFY
ncbi:MAG TPA: DUF309 domain-containing protein [Terriglobales bacterium]